MSKNKKVYVNVLTGVRITQKEYESLDAIDQNEYDKISSVRKAKAAVVIEEEEE